jgi:glycosyltransferase involved in cell wall biosynthesis
VPRAIRSQGTAVGMECRRPVVAMVTDAIHPYHRGGKEMRYHELSRHLAGYADVDIYTMNWWGGPRVWSNDAVTFHAISPLRPMYNKDRRSTSQALHFALACVRMIRYRFDVIEADHMPYFQIFVLRMIASLRRKRLVVTWHEVWGKDYWREYLGRVGMLAWLIEWLAMRMPDRIIAASPQTAERLRMILGPRAVITVAPNGIDLDAIHAALPVPETTDLVVVGRLISHKRIDMLLAAMALLQAQGRQVTCRIIGDGPERSKLLAQAERLGLQDAVEFRHDVSEQKELYSLVKSGRVFAFPSAREGFGIAVLEALACGLPVLATSAPDNLAQYLVARSSRGVVCEPETEEFARALVRMLDAEETTPRHDSDRLDAWLAEYSWPEMTKQVAEALLS